MAKTWKITLIFLGIFLAGGVAGAFVGMRIACTKGKIDSSAATQGPRQHRPIDDWSKRKQKELVTLLALTQEQQARTEVLFQDAQAELRTAREHAFQQTSEIFDRLDAQTMELLNPEQRLKFAQNIKEREERQKKAAAERAAARNEHPPKPGEPPPPDLTEKQSAPVPAPANHPLPAPGPEETPKSP